MPLSSASGAGGSGPGPGDSLPYASGLRDTPSVVNLASLEAEEHMLEHLRRDRQRAASDISSHTHHTHGSHGHGHSQARVSCTSEAISEADDGVEEDESGEGEAFPIPVPLPPLFAVTAPLVRMGMMNVVDDSFTRCFKSQKRVNWNWNCYLWPAWAMGLVFRYVILFPLRLLALLLGFAMVILVMPVMNVLRLVMNTKSMETTLIQLFASSFVASWSGVVRIHGLRPTPRPGKPAGVFVANHSSMIDFILLLQSHPYAVVGQKHAGWVGMLQDHVLESLNCVWFNRGESKDRRIVADRLQAHAHDPSKADNPMLVFPEGECCGCWRDINAASVSGAHEHRLRPCAAPSVPALTCSQPRLLLPCLTPSTPFLSDSFPLQARA